MLRVAIISMTIIAVQLNNVVRCIVAYSLATICLAALFFQLDSPFAGAFVIAIVAMIVVNLLTKPTSEKVFDETMTGWYISKQ